RQWGWISWGPGAQADAPAVRGRVVAGAELLVDVLPSRRARREHAPVERAIRGGRHRGHELEVLLGEAADHRDELEGGAGVLTSEATQLDDLVVGRVARRHLLAVG